MFFFLFSVFARFYSELSDFTHCAHMRKNIIHSYKTSFFDFFWRSLKRSSFAYTALHIFKIHINHIEFISKYALKPNYHFFFLSILAYLACLSVWQSQIITEKVTPGDPGTHLLYGRHLPCLKAHRLICKLFKLTLEFEILRE